MRSETDLFPEYPVAELVYFTVALPEELVAEIGNVLEGLAVVKTIERSIVFSILFTLADIRQQDAAVFESLCGDRKGGAGDEKT
jgi:hypothetical protein